MAGFAFPLPTTPQQNQGTPDFVTKISSIMSLKGLLSLSQLRSAVDDDSIETVVVAFTDHYGRLCGKRFDAGFFLDACAQGGTHGCDYLLTTDMEMEPVPGYSFANWELGYGDFHLVPDLNTLRVASWLEKTAMVLCDLQNEKTHSPVSVGPRSILKKQLAKAAALGYQSFSASELEYYVFETSYREAFAQKYHNLRPVGDYLEDYQIFQGTRTEPYTAAARRHLKLSGIL